MCHILLDFSVLQGHLCYNHTEVFRQVKSLYFEPTFWGHTMHVIWLMAVGWTGVGTEIPSPRMWSWEEKPVLTKWNWVRKQWSPYGIYHFLIWLLKTGRESYCGWGTYTPLRISGSFLLSSIRMTMSLASSRCTLKLIVFFDCLLFLLTYTLWSLGKSLFKGHLVLYHQDFSDISVSYLFLWDAW